MNTNTTFEASGGVLCILSKVQTHCFGSDNGHTQKESNNNDNDEAQNV